MRSIRGLALGLGLCAFSVGAQAQYTQFFTQTIVEWLDDSNLWLRGARVEGLGLTRNDEVSLRYTFQPSTASFVLSGAEVVPGVGVVDYVNGWVGQNANPVNPSYTVGGTSFTTGPSSRSFTHTPSAPFEARINLAVGHVVSWTVSGATNDYRYELFAPDGKRLSVFDSTAGTGVIASAIRITQVGEHRLRVAPRNPEGAVTFNLRFMNANRTSSTQLLDGSRWQVSGSSGIREYAKATVNLRQGERLVMDAPSSAVEICLYDSFSRKAVCPVGLPVAYVAERTDTYTLFIAHREGQGFSYNTIVRIEPAALPRIGSLMGGKEQISAPGALAPKTDPAWDHRASPAAD